MLSYLVRQWPIRGQQQEYKDCSSTETLTGVLVGDDAFKEVLLKQADKLNLILDHRMDLAGSL